MVAGYEAKWDCAIRVTGTKGSLEVLWNQPCLRVRTDTDTGWRIVETKEGLHNDVAIDRACADLLRALDEPGYKPMLTVDHAIQHTEAIFATYYSSLRRARVDLPLTYEGNALTAMLASGDIGNPDSASVRSL